MKVIRSYRTQFTTTVDERNLTIKIPLTALAHRFNCSPGKTVKASIKRGARQAFAEFVAEILHYDNYGDTNDTYITDMLDEIFDRVFEGSYSLPGIVEFSDINNAKHKKGVIRHDDQQQTKGQ